MKLGDHVRALVNGEYRHGIDCGDRTVLFLGRDTSGRPEVRRALATDFAVGAERVETVVHRERVLAPRVVVARAFSRMRDPAAAASFATSEAFAFGASPGGRPPRAWRAPASAVRPPPLRARKALAAGRPRSQTTRPSPTARPVPGAGRRASRGKRRR
jgi:hypothetical protein